MSNNYRIKVSSSKFIEESRPIAILRLNEREFLKGEIVMVNYKKDQDFKTNIGTLVAIGVKDGKGEDCYRLISTGGSVVVRKVVTSLSDVSSLVHGELYIYKDDNNKWFYVYKKKDEDNRRIEEITDGPFIFIDSESGYRWFYRDGECRREDEFFTSKQVKDIISQVLIRSDRLEVESEDGLLFKAGDVKDIVLTINTFDLDNNNISDKCEYKVNGKPITLLSNNSYVLTNVSSDTKITVECKIDLGNNFYQILRKTIKIVFGFIFYYGRVNQDWKPSVLNIKSLEYSKLSAKTNFDWVGINLENPGKTVFCYPKSYGLLDHIYDFHGIDYYKDYEIYDGNFEIDGINYLVYLKKEPVKIHNFRQNFIFNDSSDVDISGVDRDSLSDLIEMLIENKIFRYIEELRLTGLVFIDKFFYDVPTSDLIPRKIYYIESEKKLYLIQEDSTGIFKDPDIKTLYVKLPEHTIMFWNGTDLVSEGIGSEIIHNIREIV